MAQARHLVHHVADLDSGEVLTFTDDGPLTASTRASRLARLGHVFDGNTVFGGPSYRLTPRRPYQASPEAYLIASHVDGYLADADEITWDPPADLGTTAGLRGLRASFAVSPDRRSVLSVAMSGSAWPGRVGHLRVQAFSGPASVSFPIFDTPSAHTVDVSFVPLGGRPSEGLLTLEAGIRRLTVTAIAFAPQPPIVEAAQP